MSNGKKAQFILAFGIENKYHRKLLLTKCKITNKPLLITYIHAEIETKVL